MAAHRKHVEKRTGKLSAPANTGEKAEFYEACDNVGMEPADTLRKLAKAFTEHVKEHGFIVQPIRFAPPPPSPPLPSQSPPNPNT